MGNFSHRRGVCAIMRCNPGKKHAVRQKPRPQPERGTAMTRRLYLEDSHLTRCRARVLSCTPAEAGYDLTLDQTVFFPNAGGQPCDTGTLRFAGGAAAITGLRPADHACLSARYTMARRASDAPSQE